MLALKYKERNSEWLNQVCTSGLQLMIILIVKLICRLDSQFID